MKSAKNDQIDDTEAITNPVPENPTKAEVTPGEGKGVKPGDEITYEIGYQNYKDVAADITIQDTLDPNVEVVSNDPEAGLSGSTASWTIPDVPAGTSGKVTLKGKVKDGIQASYLENTAEVTVGNGAAMDTNTVKNPVTRPQTTSAGTVVKTQKNKTGPAKTGDSRVPLIAGAVLIAAIAALVPAARRSRRRRTGR